MPGNGKGWSQSGKKRTPSTDQGGHSRYARLPAFEVGMGRGFVALMRKNFWSQNILAGGSHQGDWRNIRISGPWDLLLGGEGLASPKRN